MDYTNVLSLLGGLALFLFGMKVMGDALERAAGSRLKRLLSMLTRNRALAVLMGMGVTAVIQSSSATTVMVVGFVNARLLTLSQAVGVIMGANIGTTVTSLLLSIKFDMGAICALVGMLLSFIAKRDAVKQTGSVLMGLGVLFTGLDIMSDSMAPLRDWPLFSNLMQGVSNPVLGVLLGAGVTAIIQSSSASVGLLQILCAQGLVPMNTALYILLGQNIGTCVTAMIASSGTGVNARRAAMVHLLFNVAGTLLFLIASFFVPIMDWMALLAPGNIKLQIAFTHIVFNIVSTVVMLPAATLLEKAACLLTRGEDKDEGETRMIFFDERLMAAPAVAAEQLYQETCRMGQTAAENVQHAMRCALAADSSEGAEIEAREKLCDYLDVAITGALVNVRALDLSEADNRRIATFFHVVNDFERVSDHAMNLLDIAKERADKHIKLSERAQSELGELSALVFDMLSRALNAFSGGGMRKEALAQMELDEARADDMTKALHDAHIERLKEKKCAPKSGVIFLESIRNLERVADHAMNIAALAAQKPVHTLDA